MNPTLPNPNTFNRFALKRNQLVALALVPVGLILGGLADIIGVGKGLWALTSCFNDHCSALGDVSPFYIPSLLILPISISALFVVPAVYCWLGIHPSAKYRSDLIVCGLYLLDIALATAAFSTVFFKH